MNVPINMRKFDLQQAIAGAPLVTRDNRPAKFIAYVPDVISHHQLLVKVNDEVVRYDATGTKPYGNTHWDLFLAPLGFCEGLPVFAGDKLIGTGYGAPQELIADTCNNNFELFKWPSKQPVVETRMDENEIMSVYDHLDSVTFKEAITAVANKAISRAIADGDVVPTSEIVELMCKAYNMNYQTYEFSFKQNAEFVLKDYLEGLKP